VSNIYTDIESIPGQDPAIEQDIRADIAEECMSLKHPRSYTKKESIHAWYESEREKLFASFDDRYLKCSLDGGRGEICAISFAVDDSPVFGGNTESFSERELLCLFWRDLVANIKELRKDEKEEHVWIGHNVRNFDLPFLYKRSVILGIKPPIDVPFSSGPSDKRVFDTMTAWAGWGKYISQDALCRLLGLPVKEGMTGADVYQYWQDGKYSEILEYNKRDVETVRKIHKRMTFA